MMEMCHIGNHVSLQIPPWEEHWWSWIIDERINRAWYVSHAIAAGVKREDFEEMVKYLAIRWSDKAFARNIKAKMMIAWYKCVGTKAQGRQVPRKRKTEANQDVPEKSKPSDQSEKTNQVRSIEPMNVLPSEWLTDQPFDDCEQVRIYW